jgi:hypothetical protein
MPWLDSAHSFVIDLDEAMELFERVRMPNATEEELARCFPWLSRDPAEQAAIWLLSEDPADVQPVQQAANAAGEAEGSGSGTDNQAGAGQAEGTEQPVVRAVK